MSYMQEQEEAEAAAKVLSFIDGHLGRLAQHGPVVMGRHSWSGASVVPC